MICGSRRRAARYWGWEMELPKRVQRLLSNSLDTSNITLRPRGMHIPLPEVFKSRAGLGGGGSSLIMRVMTRLIKRSISREYLTRSRYLWTRTARNQIAVMHDTLLFLALCLGSLSRPSYLIIRGSWGLLACQLASPQEKASLSRRITG